MNCAVVNGILIQTQIFLYLYLKAPISSCLQKMLVNDFIKTVIDSVKRVYEFFSTICDNDSVGINFHFSILEALDLYESFSW